MQRIIAAAPGIYGEPTAIVAVCIDWARSPHLEVDDARDTHSTYVDVGAAMQNMLLMAEALDLGACPVMSFHRPSLQTVLQLPQDWTPYVLIALGRRAQRKRPARSDNAESRLRKDVFWEKYEEAITNDG
jgi:nitroreductase